MISGRTIRRIAVDNYYSDRQVRRLKNRAIEKIANKLDE